MIDRRKDLKIVDNAPPGAVTYIMYDYGDNMEGLYLNCENQFFCTFQGIWIDVDLVDNYWHSPRRVEDIRELNELRKQQ